MAVASSSNNSPNKMTRNITMRRAMMMKNQHYFPSSIFSIVIFLVALLWAGLSIMMFEYLPGTTSTSSSKTTLFHSEDRSHQKFPSISSWQLDKTDCQQHHYPSITHYYEMKEPHYTTTLATTQQSFSNYNKDYHMFHTITSRFMVGQPNQPILEQARLLLFETFCYPTMKYQSQQNYFWFVLVDPRLSHDILQTLQSLLHETNFPSNNAYMILTNNTAWAADGVGVPGVTSYGVGLHEIAYEYKMGKVDIVTGNTTYLLDALNVMEGKTNKGVVENGQRHLLLIETLLDADDGLNNHGVEWIQNLAGEHTKQQQTQLQKEHEAISLNSTWWVFCGTDHIEWHNRDIYQLTRNQYQEFGLTSGITGIRHAPLYCASAGYTRVGLTTVNTPGLSSKDDSHERKLILFPQKAYSNHAMAVDFPSCNTTYMSECFRREFSGKAYIIKSRTITSDSMDHMNPKRNDYRDNSWENKTEHPLLINETEKTWKVLQDEFSIRRLQAWETSVFLRENAETIVKQNQESRCAPGFPCRLVAERTFKKMSSHLKMLDRREALLAKAAAKP